MKCTYIVAKPIGDGVRHADKVDDLDGRRVEGSAYLRSGVLQARAVHLHCLGEFRASYISVRD
jgi:hypothetical protein